MKMKYLTLVAVAAVAFVGGCSDENSAVPANSAEKTVPAEAGVPAAPAVQAAKFSWEFVERPKVGDVILKVNRAEGRGSVRVFAEYDMPSMRGHHASGKVEFKRNRAGDYVLPIHFAMPGDWEIVLIFEENGAEIGRETILTEI